MNNLLLDEHPLIILPSLATSVGLNEAVILQQLHYWLQHSNHEHEGRKWVYNTYQDWKEQFPFWSTDTIKRTITKLEKKGIILSANYNKLKIDKTKWYSIDYEKLGYAPSMRAKCPIEKGSLHPPLPETTTKTNKTKKQYAEYVHMQEKEYDKLIERFGQKFTDRCIEVLDGYKGSTGKKYKDDYRAILNWTVDRVKKEMPTPIKSNGGIKEVYRNGQRVEIET